MGGKKDGLRYAIGRARLTGSAKTIYNHRKEANCFVDALRELRLGVEKWTNINNKHVSKVARYWLEKGIKPATIKNYLSSVRSMCRAYGNTRIHDDNSAFGVPNRVYITNINKAVSDATYKESVDLLESSGDPLKAMLSG